MNKVLVLPVLLLSSALVFMFGSSPEPFVGPRTVAKVGLVNQTAAIPTTTLLTVGHTAVFRVSAYLSMTVPGPDPNNWVLRIDWTDDTGAESNQFCQLNAFATPPNDYAPNCALTFKAISGTPITYTVSGSDGGTYGLALAVERL